MHGINSHTITNNKERLCYHKHKCLPKSPFGPLYSSEVFSDRDVIQNYKKQRYIRRVISYGQKSDVGFCRLMSTRTSPALVIQPDPSYRRLTTHNITHFYLHFCLHFKYHTHKSTVFTVAYTVLKNK